jgi:hypothetical protein
MMRYARCQIGRVWFAECDDRQGQIGLGETAATSVAPRGGFDHGFLSG